MKSLVAIGGTSQTMKSLVASFGEIPRNSALEAVEWPPEPPEEVERTSNWRMSSSRKSDTMK